MSDFIIGDNLELESFFRQNTNALHEQNILLKKNAILQIFEKVSDPNISQSDYICQQILLKYGKELLKAFSDQVEKVREYSIKTITNLVINSEDNEPLLSYIFSVLIERSNCQDLEGILHLPEVMRPPPSQLPQRLFKFIEESEEIRLMLVELLYQIMCKNESDNLHEFIDDIVDIHRAFLMDPFGEVQKAACKSLSKFCRVNQQMLLHFTEKMGRALLHPLVSKKSPIRIAALESLSSVLLCGVWKNNAFVFEVLTGFKDPNSVPIKAFYEPMHHINYLATLIIDPKPQVRQAFIKEIGFWLTELADRWDHHARLIPYLLSGLFDSDSSIQEASMQIIQNVGKEWEIEKEKEVKDIQQLGVEAPWTIEGQLSELPLPQPFKERPKLGMRGFIKSQVRKMWPAIYKEILEQNEDNRLRASHLMLLGVIFSEDYMTQFLDNFIPKTIMAIKIPQTKIEKQIYQNFQSTYHLIGRYCDYTAYTLIIFSSMRGKFIRNEQYIKSATQALAWLCNGAIEATINKLGSKCVLITNILDLLSEKDQIESISNLNVLEIKSLLQSIYTAIDTKATLQEKQEILEQYSHTLNLLENVLIYISNFSSVLLNSQLNTQQQYILSQKPNYLKFIDFDYQQILFGDSKWKNLISEITYLYKQGSTSVYSLTDQLYILIVSSTLPEPIDFILKLIQLYLQSFDANGNKQLQLQVILKLLSSFGQWISQLDPKQFQQSLYDHFLATVSLISTQLSKRRDIGKTMQKDQLSLTYYCTLINSLCNSFQTIFKKQYHLIVSIIQQLCEFMLPYPNSKHLIDNKNQYMLPKLIIFTFDALDQYGGEQKQETRKQLFQILAYINQFIPTQETYLGDVYIVQEYSSYIQKILRLCIEEKDYQCQDLYRIMLKELCNKTRNSFVLEYEQAKYNNQLSRAELLSQLIK